jgi:signal transduction histidine kinase
VCQNEFIVKTATQQEWWMRLNRHFPMNRRTVVVSTPHHDVFEQVQLALATLPLTVEHVPDLHHALAYLQAQKAVLTLWDVQENDSEAMVEALKIEGPVLALAAFETLTPIQWMLLRLADETVKLPFNAAELEARLKKSLKATFRQGRTPPKSEVVDRLKVTLHHEIRNPLTSIMIGSQALAHQFQEGSAEKKVLSSVEQSAKRIQTVMDTLLTNPHLPIEEYIEGVQMLSIPS